MPTKQLRTVASNWAMTFMLRSNPETFQGTRALQTPETAYCISRKAVLNSELQLATEKLQ